jgi:plastocyanin
MLYLKISQFARPLFIGILLIVVAAMGCSSNKSTNSNYNPTPPAQHSAHYHTVAIAGMAFSPATITITAGDTVAWTNNDSINHTVTSDSGSELGSAPLGQGQTYSHLFGAAGVFLYHCSIHTTMHGVITVQ